MRARSRRRSQSLDLANHSAAAPDAVLPTPYETEQANRHPDESGPLKAVSSTAICRANGMTRRSAQALSIAADRAMLTGQTGRPHHRPRESARLSITPRVLLLALVNAVRLSMRVSCSACRSPVVVITSEIGPSRSIRATRATGPEAGIVDCRLVDDPPLADQSTEQHRNAPFSSACKLGWLRTRPVSCGPADGRRTRATTRCCS